MANQVEPSTVGGAAQQREGLVHQAPGSSATTHVTFHGRTVSWVAVSAVMVGFLIGALALVFGKGGPTWWLFWTGAGLAVVGGLLAMATDIFEDWY